jgi:hypothetical protein
VERLYPRNTPRGHSMWGLNGNMRCWFRRVVESVGEYDFHRDVGFDRHVESHLRELHHSPIGCVVGDVSLTPVHPVILASRMSALSS